MSRIPYRGGRGDDLAYGDRQEDFGYGGRGGGVRDAPAGGNRWDSDRFASERGGRPRFESSDRLDRDVYEERDTRVVNRGGGFGRPRERSVDEIYERRGPGFGDDRYERRHYHDDDAPRFERAPPPFAADPWDRHNSTSVTIEKERYSPPPARRGSNRPGFMRRQSSLDTFDRKPLTRFVDREEYGPPARYRPETRPPIMTPIPLPKTRQLGPPPRRYAERDYDDIGVAEPDRYGDDEYRAYPERVREREVIRRRRRSKSRDSIRSRRSHRGESVRSDSISSSSSSDRGTVRSVRNEFPKRGKTRMPARLVSRKAIIDLGYPFEEEGDTIIIMKALGRENIDEVIKLSEVYNDNDRVVETEQTTYLVGPGADFSGGRSEAGTIIEERKTQEIFTVPPPPVAAPIPMPIQEVVTDTKIIEHHDHHHHGASGGPIIVNAGPHPHHHHDHVTEIRETQYVDRSDPVPVGPLALVSRSRSQSRDEHAIRAEIRALKAEQELLQARRGDGRRLRHGGRISNDLVVYDKEHFHANGEDVTIVRKEAIVEPDGGVRIEKDRKGRMAISVPKYIR